MLAASSGANVQLLETHISYVLLTGSFAYKIKKIVNLGFLDFTTLAQRRFYCHEELRLNRRLAPALYLEVVPITGTFDAPHFAGKGPTIEYALKMREFPQDALASHASSQRRLSAAHIDALAAEVATFHRASATALPNAVYGSADAVRRVALQTFGQIRALLTDTAKRLDLDALRQWTREQHAAIAGAIEERRVRGAVRECHGDLHLGNIALIAEHPVIFDCIEFDDALRWIDVMSEVAFTVMDLHYRGEEALAARFLNSYLEITGDYRGLKVLRFYLVYRAMVRAMVARERAHQLEPGADASTLRREYEGYVTLAKRYTKRPRPALIITHGLSGCGKTTWSQFALEAEGAIRIRTDVERKRLRRIDSRNRRPDALDSDLYSAEVTRETYRHVLAIARESVSAGFVTIIDGTFLMRWQRQMFRKLAVDADVPFLIVSFVADDAMLRERILHRLQAANDASDADSTVLDRQLRSRQPLADEELANVLTLDANASIDEMRASGASIVGPAIDECRELALPHAQTPPVVAA